jgi:signal transduction histidine kinase
MALLGASRNHDDGIMYRPPRLDPELTGPWFRRRPVTTFVVCGTLYAAIFVLSLVATDTDTVGLLYTFPVALLALASGRRAGLLAGAVSLSLLAQTGALDEASFSTTDWVSLAAPLGLIGILVGDASTRDREAEAARLELASVRLRQREAAEINDSIVQGLVAAKWSLEAEDPIRALEVVAETMATAQAHVSDLLGECAPDANSRLTVNGRT